MAEKAARDYAHMIKSISLEKETDPLCTHIEDLLTRLDEFETLLSSVKTERMAIQEYHVKGILGFSANFEQLRARVDNLEKFVEVVSTNVDKVEKSIDIAEEELKVTDYSFRGLVIKPFLARTNRTAADGAEVVRSNLRDGEFQPVAIFKANDYFGGSGK